VFGNQQAMCGLIAVQPLREQASNSRFPERPGLVCPSSEPVPSPAVRSAISRWAADPAVEVLRSGPMTILKWALIFFLVSIVAGILGFTDISAASADVARFLFYVFVVIFLVLLILGLTIFRV
jgi:uncharacterized membrane protein YtjA (UPF0391 family)